MLGFFLRSVLLTGGYFFLRRLGLFLGLGSVFTFVRSAFQFFPSSVDFCSSGLWVCLILSMLSFLQGRIRAGCGFGYFYLMVF